MKRFRTIVAVILSVLMLSTVCATAFTGSAAGTKATAELTKTLSGESSEYPLIVLPGINHSVTYVANEDGTPAVNADGKELSGGLLIIDDSGLVGKIVKKLLWPLLSSLFLQFDNGLSDAAYELVCELFALQSCDKEGNQIYNLQTYSYNYPVSEMDEGTRSWFYRMLPMQVITEKIGEDNVYLYTFPLVGDPMESARGLVEYIEMVKRQKGVSKVNIATVSLGGTILTAYADIIDGDWSNVNSVTNVVALLDGTDIIADFYARDWNLSDEFLYSSYIRNVMKQMNGSDTLGCVINAALRLFSRKTVNGLLTGAFEGLLDTLLINNPQFWAMVPADRYEELADRYLTGDEYAVLRAKTDAFQQARLDLCNNLLDADSDGVAVNNICGYNLTYTDGEYCFFGIVASSATANGDGIIPIASTSLGATSAPAGTSLSEEYLAGADLAHVSPDGSVDASTCLFPDHVWFFNGQHHEIGYNDVAIGLMAAILTGEVTDVNSSEAYPQFNGHRSTRQLTRWDFPDAETVMDNAEGQYTDEQIAAVKDAYDEAKALMKVTVLGENAQNDVDAATEKLQAALVAAGIRQAGGRGNSWFDSALETGCGKGDDLALKIFRGNGYFDWNHIGDLNERIFGSIGEGC